MNVKRSWAAALAGTLFLARPAYAIVEDIGAGAAHFLLMGAGARPLGMGEAYSAVGEGAESIYWNPAGLARLSKPQFHYSRAETMRFMHHDFAAYAHPIPKWGGTVAGSLAYVLQDSLPVITNANATVGKFSPHAEVATIAYAQSFNLDAFHPDRDREYFQEKWNIPGVNRPLRRAAEPWTGRLSAGLAFKVIRETLYNRAATAFALDGGVLYRPSGMDRLALSFVFRNAGSRVHFIREHEVLPVEIEAGAAYDKRWKRHRLLSTISAVVPYHGMGHGKLGLEYSLPLARLTRVAVRTGFKSMTVRDLQPMSGLTAGVGIQHRALSFDVGFQPLAQLGEAYRLSLSYRW